MDENTQPTNNLPEGYENVDSSSSDLETGYVDEPLTTDYAEDTTADMFDLPTEYTPEELEALTPDAANAYEPQDYQEDIAPDLSGLDADAASLEPVGETPGEYGTDELMQEFGLNTNGSGAVVSADGSSALAPPPPRSGGKRIIVLIIVTLLLFALLIASIWYFFLKSDDTPGATPTPTPNQQITPGTTNTHLECRFGLCVEVPNTDGGSNSNQCSSSFDCEQAPILPTATPTLSDQAPSPTDGVVPTVIPATSPTATPAVQPSLTPAITPTIATTTPTKAPTTVPTNAPTVTPTRIPTATPTPLASTLPDSGSTESTLFFGLLILMLLGGGFFLLKKQ